MYEQEHNPYQPPTTNSINIQSTQHSQKRTIDEAISNGYDFNIDQIISQAWARVKGVKLPFFKGTLLIMVIHLITQFVMYVLDNGQTELTLSYELFLLGLSIFFMVVVNYFNSGYIPLALKHLRNEPIKFTQDFFSIFNIFSTLLIAISLTIILTSLAGLLLIIPGIYLYFAYSLTKWILVDNPSISAWQAMEASRKLITQHWFKVFSLSLFLSIISLISIIPFGIGLIWSAPLVMLAKGILYQTIFEK